jgi:cysteine synthase A
MKANSILDAIGGTPLIRINKLFAERPDVEVWLKLERQNPGGSIKDRIALSMIEQAEKDGILTKDSHIVEPTSGNTGVGLALVAAVKGYKITLVMPESMSIERRRLMSAYGANLELTPREQGMKGAIAKAQEMVDQGARRDDGPGNFARCARRRLRYAHYGGRHRRPHYGCN